MLGFFRRILHSRAGVIITFIALGVIALAFAAGDVTGLGHSLGSVAATDVANVGDDKISEAELASRTRAALEGVQQQHPTADMAGLLAANGVERILDQLISARAFAEFGKQQGMVVSKRAVDGELGSIAAFRGPDGKFSQLAYEGALARQRVSDKDVREDIARERLVQQLTAPANGGARLSRQFALPYASLLLERRKGTIGYIPATALLGGPAPTDAELTAFYQANLPRFTVPERRVMRYVLVTPDSVKGQAAPTDADIAAAYRAEPARFAAAQQRSAQVVVVLDQAQAAAIAAKVKGGTALDAAARVAGLEARTLAALDKAGFAQQTSVAVADAVFAAPAAGVVGPIRAGGSFTVAKLTAVTAVPAKTLDQARAELLPEVTKRKQGEAITKLNDALDSAASGGATFDEIVKDQHLTALKTAALTTAGIDPLDPKTPPDPALATVVQAGFGAEQGDAPQIVPVGNDGGFAFVTLDSVAPAAPRSLAEIKADVAQAFAARRAGQAARKLADQVVAKVNAGTPLAAALTATGLKLPATKPIDLPRAALAANPNGPEPALALLFSMAPKKAKLIADPQGAGIGIVYLDTIVPGDAQRDARAVTATQGDLSRVAGGELVAQFGAAVRAAVGVKQSAEALKRVKAQLSGQSPDTQP